MSNDSAYHDQRRPDVRAQHDGQRRHEPDGAAGEERLAIKAVAVLLCSSSVTPVPAAQARRRLRRAAPEHPAQLAAEGAQHAGADHVDAPEQERHLAQQLEQRVRGRHRAHGRGAALTVIVRPRAAGRRPPCRARGLPTSPSLPVANPRRPHSIRTAVL